MILTLLPHCTLIDPQGVPNRPVPRQMQARGCNHAHDHEQPGPPGCPGNDMTTPSLLYHLHSYPPILHHISTHTHTILHPSLFPPSLNKCCLQFPHELVTYGGNGQVFSNWVQFLLTMHYLSLMEWDQTLVMYSGHPMGLFPSHPEAPRCVITNGMVCVCVCVCLCVCVCHVRVCVCMCVCVCLCVCVCVMCVCVKLKDVCRCVLSL